MGIRCLPVLLCLIVCAAINDPNRVAAELPPSPVAFTRDVAPLLRANCVACHRDGKTEGGLNLESLGKLRQGGDTGSVISSGNPGESLIWLRVTGLEEPIMPPEDNTVAAKQLNEQQLATLKSWLQHDDGKTEETATAMSPLASRKWTVMPSSVRSIGAIDVSVDGTYAAIAQANRVQIVDLSDPSKRVSLVDEAVPG